MREALRQALPGAITQQEPARVRALRAALAAIENAEALPAESATTTTEHVAGAALGVGAAEARRRELTEEEVLEIVTQERDERLEAAAEYRRAGRDDAAAEMEVEAAALDAFLC